MVEILDPVVLSSDDGDGPNPPDQSIKCPGPVQQRHWSDNASRSGEKGFNFRIANGHSSTTITIRQDRIIIKRYWFPLIIFKMMVMMLVLEEMMNHQHSVWKSIAAAAAATAQESNNNNRIQHEPRPIVEQIYCDFNHLCLCQNYTSQYMDVTCINVPLDRIPVLVQPKNNDYNDSIGGVRNNHRLQNLYRLRIIGAKQLIKLMPEDFENLITLASLTVAKTKLFYIDPDTFSRTPIKHTLTTIDLSNGGLLQIPSQALAHLKQLQWLSLKQNQIEVIKQNELSELKALRTLLLNENQLYIVEDGTFAKFSSLELINFDGNMIERVEGQPFPSTLRSLNIANCLLRKIPFDSIQNLPRLEILQLQGNLINHLSPFKLAVQRINLIDLSHNLIAQLPSDLFANFNLTTPTLTTFDSLDGFNGSRRNFNDNGNKNSSSLKLQQQRQQQQQQQPSSFRLRIEQLCLDFNFIQSLRSDLFGMVLIEKLSLSNNRISSQLIAPNAFAGPTRNGLKVLDLNYNLIDNYPSALKSLKSLRQLLLKNNRINKIDPDAFINVAETLELLDLSQNSIERIPRKALRVLRNLIKINFHDNSLSRIHLEDFSDGGWCQKLKSLTLSKNNLVHLPPQALMTCTKLNELRLGGNKLLQVSPYLLAPRLPKLQLLDLSSLNSVDWTSRKSPATIPPIGSIDDDGTGAKLDVTKQHRPTIVENNQTFANVKWLQFDFNFLQTIPEQMLQLFPSIKHLDLQNNAINLIGADQFRTFRNLTSIILSHNNLTGLWTNSFRELKQLESVTLYFNRIERIERNSFQFLPRLQSLVLSRNRINYLEPNSFNNVSYESKSLSLLLDGNQLDCLQAETFQSITPSASELHQPHQQLYRHPPPHEFYFYLNASNNQIKTFSNCQNWRHTTTDRKGQIANFGLDEGNVDDHEGDGTSINVGGIQGALPTSNQRGQTLPIRVLDLSHNRIVRFSPSFYRQFCRETFSLLVNNNLIRSLSMELFQQCRLLQTLSLNYNYIFNVDHHHDPPEHALMEDFPIQTMSLQHNVIEKLDQFRALFNRSRQLKSLNLNYNRIRRIPRDVFAGTGLLSLYLAHNQIILEQEQESNKAVDGGDDDKCFGVQKTLKFLDISFNALTTIPKRILECLYLNELILNDNRLRTFNHIESLGHALTNLQRLELNHNPIHLMAHGDITNNKNNNHRTNLQFLNNNSMLTMLNLNNLNIVQLEELNLPYLRQLDLSHNRISKINTRILSRSRNIRWLNLAQNQLNEVPKHIWKYVTRLQRLDLRDNPIDMLDSSSFAGLKYLRYLDIRGLNLQFIDSRIFIYQSQMLTLKISTYPQIRSFRLQDILSKSDSLKTIMIDVKESILSHQIQWAFGGKLRELIITGRNLAVIVPDAFQGLNNANDLILRITNTSIKHLPDGMLKYLADIRYITIDLRDNYLKTVSPSVFFNVDWKNSLKTWQSRQLLGGIMLDNNPLICDCNLLWISQWMREVFTEMKSINVEAAIHAKSTLSLSQCRLLSCGPVNNTLTGSSYILAKNISIIDLRPEDICQDCQLINHNHHNDQNGSKSIIFNNVPMLIIIIVNYYFCTF